MTDCVFKPMFGVYLRYFSWCIYFCVRSHQVVAAGVVHHPALFHHRGAFPLGVFDGLNHAHQRDVAAGARAASQQEEYVHLPDLDGQQVKFILLLFTNCLLQNGSLINKYSIKGLKD